MKGTGKMLKQWVAAPRSWLAAGSVSLKTFCVLTALAAGTAAQAVQTESLTLDASGVVSRLVFDFGPRPWIDDYAPAQTGFRSSPLMDPPAGARTLLTANPTITATFTYDPAGLSPLNNNSVLRNHLGGSTLTANLPGGVGGAPLAFSNSGGGFAVSSFGNNGRLEPTGDVLALPGSIDYFTVGMAGAFSNASITLSNNPPRSTKVDLLSDPFFITTYNGAVPLPALSQLTVTVEHPATVQLGAPALVFLDRSGTAFTGPNPPPTIPTANFADALFSMPFSGVIDLAIEAADYANSADYSAATAWLSASGFRSVSLSQSTTWAISPVPEPSKAMLLLFGLGIVFLARQNFSRRSESNVASRVFR